MDPITGVVLFAIFLVGFIVIIGRKREKDDEVRFDPYPNDVAFRASSKTTNAHSEFERRLERQGIMVLESEARAEYDAHDASSYFFYEEGGQRVSMRAVLERCDPAQLHQLFAQQVGWCSYCKGNLYDVTKIVSSPAPDGARNVGQQRLAKAFSCCRNCGLMKDATEHLPDKLIVTNNFLNWLEAQENASSVPVLQEERLARLVIERERLQPRLASLDLAIARLESELRPRTDTDPFRGAPPPFTEDDELSDDPNLPRDLSRY